MEYASISMDTDDDIRLLGAYAMRKNETMQSSDSSLLDRHDNALTSGSTYVTDRRRTIENDHIAPCRTLGNTIQSRISSLFSRHDSSVTSGTGNDYKAASGIVRFSDSSLFDSNDNPSTLTSVTDHPGTLRKTGDNNTTHSGKSSLFDRHDYAVTLTYVRDRSETSRTGHDYEAPSGNVRSMDSSLQDRCDKPTDKLTFVTDRNVKPRAPVNNYPKLTAKSPEDLANSDVLIECLSTESPETMKSVPTVYLGQIVKLKDSYGFIEPSEKLPNSYKKQQVQFVFDNVIDNQCPQANSEVEFEINGNSKPDKPSAKWVRIIGENLNSSNKPKNESAKQNRFPELYIGKVKTIKKSEEKTPFGFLKPLHSLPQAYEQKDVFFSLKNVQSGGLELDREDKLEFSLGVKDKENPVGFKLKLVECKPRSAACIESYIKECLHQLINKDNVDISSEWLLGLMTCPAVWNCIGNTKLSFMGIENLMKFIKYLEKESKGLYENYKQSLEEFSSTPLLHPQKGRFHEYIKELSSKGDSKKWLETKEFLFMIMKYVPKKTRAVVSFVKPLLSTNSKKEMFLYNILKQASKSTDACIEDMEWDELPLVPSITEMLNGILESNIAIQPVIPKGPYDSVQQYIDTYFRLLRADCFEALTKGIRSLLSGKLDPRDMHVYHDIELAGILITQNESGLSLGLKVNPQAKIKNWEYASNLMFGNLVCISPSGNFKDVIWATVVDRSLLKSKQIVLLDLCTECNDVSDPEAVRLLEVSSGKGLMAESPAYYRAYQPVLKALQRLKPEELPFQRELVQTQKSAYPDFIQEDSKIDGSVVYSNFTKNTDFMSFCMDESAVGTTTLDHSQQTAVKQALRNKVAIIQGPPGTGKTFIGIKLIQLLASLEPKPNLPMVVLTYKNHALDEFLKDLLPLFPGRVARIGGRSQDSELEGCNLNELKRDRVYRMSDNMFQEVRKCRDMIEEMKPKVIKTLKELCGAKTLTLRNLRSSLSSKQIQCILQGCNWEQIKLPSLQQTDEDGFKVASGKKSKAKVVLMTKQEALEILESLACNAEDFLQNNDHHEDPMWQQVNKMVERALVQWLPDKNTFTKVTENKLGHIKLSSIEIVQENLADDSDEKDTEELEKERLAASNSKYKTKEELLKEMVMLSSENKSTDWAPELAPNTKNLIKDLPVGYLVNTENLWELNMKDRVLFVQALLFSLFEEKGKDFENILKEYQQICTAKNEIENQHKVDILKRMSIVGMTITGASINQQLLSQLKPAIVVVEEAAEVLEPQLLATIGSWCQHLVLIGDHKQLTPPVESFTLRKDFHFDVSMMERLINNELEYATLVMQNRMLPEFAFLLEDIYPRLQSNLERVNKNQPAPCLNSSMYFWDHTCPETSARSYSNEEEANRAIRLALFLIQQHYEPHQITILGAYLGQVRLLKQKMRQAEVEHNSIFDMYKDMKNDKEEQGDSDSKKANKVKIQTIDNYQGDENEIVIVSLVRSNNNNKVGFLNTLNRRCVAQSRAKCGMYFIGNRNTILASQHWGKIIGEMAKQDNVGTCIKLQCSRHPFSEVLAQSAEQITLKTFCKEMCRKNMSCNKHLCVRPCQPRHAHLFCYEKVPFIFDKCGHAGERRCKDAEAKMLCKQKVPITFSCNHTGERLCYKAPESVKCKEKCAKLLPCKHPCSKFCSEPCDNVKTCKECERKRQVEKEIRRKAKEAEIKVKKEEIKSEIDEMEKNFDDLVYQTELTPSGNTASEYYDVEDMVKKFIQVGHNWYPKVTKIIKIRNDRLKLKWLIARKRLFDPLYAPMKFHGTSAENVQAIIDKGFLLPKPNKQMYGPGIYFATDSSKSALEIYTKGSNTLLLCSVLLGKPITVTSARTDMTHQKLKIQGYDSLYAKRDTQKSGGVRYDEYVVYHPDQALPEYLIHYDKLQIQETDIMDKYEKRAISQQKIIRRNILPSREIKANDVLDAHFRIAESQYLRLVGYKKLATKYSIKSVEYVVNPPLVQNFRQKWITFQTKYPCTPKSDYILAFHGSTEANIKSIVRTNFDLKRLASNTGNKGAFGAGIYFSEFPEVSIGYGSSLLLCKVLPGRSFDVPDQMLGAPLQSSYDSHRVKKDAEGRGHEIVIFDADQILPCYIINLN